MRPKHFTPTRHFCQHDEEAIVLRLFEGLGHRKKLCDIGARLLFSNSARLIFDYGYEATLVEPNPGAAAELRDRFKDYPVTVHEEKAFIHNINSFVGDADFLTIDTDGNDWWLWAAVEAKPRVVCIEFNHCKEGLYICPYDEKIGRGRRNKVEYGGSKEAFLLLGKLKGYVPIAETGVNLIFALAEADPTG